jgi:uncharacterized protein (TIGR03067 family)
MTPTLLVACLALSAPVPKAIKRAVNDSPVGQWEVIAATYGGNEYPSALGTKWTLKDDGNAIRDRPQEGISTATFTIDSQADPKTFDWQTAEGFTFHGVYEVT